MTIKDIYSEGEDRTVRGEPNTGEDLLHIDWDEYRITNSDNREYLVGTNELATCVGSAVYDPETEVGAVSHSLPYNNPDMKGDLVVEQMLSELTEAVDSSSLEATVVTGSNPNPEKLNEVYYSLEHHPEVDNSIEWVEMTDANGPTSSGSVVLNTENGKLEPLSWLL